MPLGLKMKVDMLKFRDLALTETVREFPLLQKAIGQELTDEKHLSHKKSNSH